MATGTVTASKLNFRSSPDSDTDQNILRTLPKGISVGILEEQGEWLKVRVDGQEGFVSANFVHREKETPADDDADSGDAPSPGASPNPVTGVFRFVGNKAIAPDGTKFAKKFKLGVFNFGTTSIAAFVSNNESRFQNISPSRLRVMQAVSENEGKLEAINTWDNAFLTFGAFQWTVGVGAGAGELPSVIGRLKQNDPQIFEKYFGQFGLDVAGINSQPGVLPTGFFSLNGARLNTSALKRRLRTLEWAYRFWLAGHDDAVRQVEIEHAMERVDLFYRSDRAKIRNRFVADYVSSEFGVALLLDQHVNRPGHVPGTLARAVEKFVAQLGPDSPQTWTDADERNLLKIYIQLRAQTNMTDSTKRADAIRRAVTNGLASDKRGSYQP